MRGLIIGKFMPPHKGHEALCRFGASWSSQLAVVVCTMPGEPIEGEQRVRWMRQMLGGLEGVEVIHLGRPMPQAPEEAADFWEQWTTALLDVLPWVPQVVFASEAYGMRLARCFGARFVPMDPGRGQVPVSGTQVRADPLGQWEHLPREVRGHYAKRVSIFGPESTGKSTLAAGLARAFGTVWVPEYARVHLEWQQGALSPQDMVPIAKGQAAMEEARVGECQKVLVCDTDPLATVVWSQALFGSCDPQVWEIARGRHYDLTLLCAVDVPWVGDQVRYLPGERQSFLDRCEEALVQAGRQVVWIRGDWQQRQERASLAVGELLGTE